MKSILFLLFILISFSLGAIFGNRIGADSRAYYDAPAKLKVLSSVLDQKKENNWVEGEITKQVRILNESDITPYKSAFFLKLSGNSIFISEYEKYLPIVTNSLQYKESMKLLCEYNEKYLDRCE